MVSKRHPPSFYVNQNFSLSGVNANYLTGTLCRVEGLQRVGFILAYTEEKKSNNKIKNKRTWNCRYFQKWVWVTITACLTLTTLSNNSGGYLDTANISENIPLPNKYALTRSTKNLFKTAVYQQAT